jgi:hypothetical protein
MDTIAIIMTLIGMRLDIRRTPEFRLSKIRFKKSCPLECTKTAKGEQNFKTDPFCKAEGECAMQHSRMSCNGTESSCN